VVGGTVVGSTVVGATVVGATVVGATVVGGTVVGGTVVGGTVVAGVVDAPVVDTGAGAVEVAVSETASSSPPLQAVIARTSVSSASGRMPGSLAASSWRPTSDTD
jgi:hypothetical protein